MLLNQTAIYALRAMAVLAEIGSKQIANFLAHSMPQLGSVMLGVFSCGVWVITAFYLWRGRRESGRLAALAAASPT